MTEATASVTKKSFIERMIGAALLDVGTYEEVEHDVDATRQAAGVVVLVAICAALGGVAEGQGGLIGRPVTELLGWLVWSGVTYLIGTRLFSGTATWGELLRTIGFAKAPGVLFILGPIPFLGGLAAAVASIWMLFAGLVGIRQALDISTSQALITAFLGWLAGVAVGFVLFLLFGIPAAVMSSM
jgi:hypothetical protein